MFHCCKTFKSIDLEGGELKGVGFKIDVTAESSSCYEAIVAESYFSLNISCHCNVSGSQFRKALRGSKMVGLSSELFLS